jgi:propanol-preferring alcohol dehydrogenase
VAVIGAGGLGLHAIHYARVMSGARVLTVDRRPDALVRAREAGAGDTIVAGESAPARLQELTAGLGCRAVIDFVGSDESLALAASTVGRRGVIALLGLSGGRLSLGFDTLAPEATITTVVAGTLADLQQVVRLAPRHPFAVPLTTYPLDEVGTALADLRAGRITGRAVIVPSR